MARERTSPIAGILVLALYTSPSHADEGCTATSDDCVTVGHWNLSVQLGAGIRTNPLAHGQDIPLVVIPRFSYYGARFFIEDLDPGLTLCEGNANTLSLVASPGYDRVFFYRTDLQNLFVSGPTAAPGTQEFPPRAPKITYLAGPEWTFKYAGVAGQVDYLHEITGHNHGHEIRAALGIPLGKGAGSWSANMGVTWKSSAIVNYYYGYPGFYEPGWALNPFAKISYSRPLTNKWTLAAFVHCERLGNAIADSPIVGQRYVTTAFIGATYVIHK